MPNVNFYLKKPERSTGKSLIYLQFKCNRQRLVYSFGQTIFPKDWNGKKQRVKLKNQTTIDGKHNLNDLLENLQKVLLSKYNQELKNGNPHPQTLKDAMDGFIYQNSEDAETDGPTLYKLIDRFIANEIKFKGRGKSPNTIKTYQTVNGHLQKFEKKTGTKICFEGITLDFYYKYISYLEDEGLKQNAIAKDIQIIKLFMNEAADLGYTDNLQFKRKKFSVNRVETDSVYLTEKEITGLYRFDLTGNKRLEQVRDLFVFGCCVGLRFSDYSTIKPENIVRIEQDEFIKLTTQKTKETVIIPCNPIVLEIFKKYSGNRNRLPNAISNQKFNEYIKEVCELAGLDETGRLSTDMEKKLYDCVTSHTARRSFATNYYLQGFPTLDLMKITGHRTERAFLRYIKVSKLTTAQRLSEHMKKRNWDVILGTLKVAG